MHSKMESSGHDLLNGTILALTARTEENYTRLQSGCHSIPVEISTKHFQTQVRHITNWDNLF